MALRRGVIWLFALALPAAALNSQSPGGEGIVRITPASASPPPSSSTLPKSSPEPRPLDAAPPVDAAATAATTATTGEFAERLASLAPADVVAAVELARWAIDQALPAQASDLCRQILDRDPQNQDAYGLLLEACQGRELSWDSDCYRAARALLTPRFREYQTTRFIVLSDASPQWSIAQINRLERTDHQFHRLTTRLQLRPQPLRHKLVCLLFNSREDYQAFARSNDRVEDPWIGGYYSPQHDWVVFYFVESNPSVEKARKKLAEMRHAVGLLQGDVRQAKQAGRAAEAQSIQRTLNQHEQHLRDQTSKVDAFAQQVSASTTTHEATHQLLFHTRVQSPHALYPLWISEGLATSFETDSPSHAFGPDHEYAPRRDAFRRLLRENRLLPLRELVALAETTGRSQETIHQLYHESYALVTWMCRFRARPMREYFDAMLASAAAGDATPDPLATFERCFGPVEKVERDWLSFERSQLKP